VPNDLGIAHGGLAGHVRRVCLVFMGRVRGSHCTFSPDKGIVKHRLIYTASTFYYFAIAFPLFGRFFWAVLLLPFASNPIFHNAVTNNDDFQNVILPVVVMLTYSGASSGQLIVHDESCMYLWQQPLH